MENIKKETSISPNPDNIQIEQNFPSDDNGRLVFDRRMKVKLRPNGFSYNPDGTIELRKYNQGRGYEYNNVPRDYSFVKKENKAHQKQLKWYSQSEKTNRLAEKTAKRKVSWFSASAANLHDRIKSNRFLTFITSFVVKFFVTLILLALAISFLSVYFIQPFYLYYYWNLFLGLGITFAVLTGVVLIAWISLLR